VATVDSDGLVRCLRVGYASLMVITEDENIFASCDLYVTGVIQKLKNNKTSNRELWGEGWRKKK